MFAALLSFGGAARIRQELASPSAKGDANFQRRQNLILAYNSISSLRMPNQRQRRRDERRCPALVSKNRRHQRKAA